MDAKARLYLLEMRDWLSQHMGMFEREGLIYRNPQAYVPVRR